MHQVSGRRSWLLFGFFLYLGSISVPVMAQLSANAIARAKHATVLVLAGDTSEGTAFCIASGYFLTNYHVIRDCELKNSVRLVLNFEDKPLQKIAAEIIAVDRERDLALLKANPVPGVATLPLGNDSALVETSFVAALGFPFGTAIAIDGEASPAVSISTGHITSLRKAGGALQLIQLDASLVPGNSGGPVLDSSGSVIGIVKSGVAQTNVNFAIPIAFARDFLAGARFRLTPANIRIEAAHQSQDFHIEILPLPDLLAEPTIRVKLSTSDDQARVFTAKMTSPGHYTFSAIPVPADQSLASVTLAVRTLTGMVNYRVKDQPIKIGRTSILLSQVDVLDCFAGRATLQSGSQITGPIAGLESVTVMTDNGDKILNFSRAGVISVTKVEQQGVSLNFTITAMDGDKLLARTTGKIGIGAALSSEPLQGDETDAYTRAVFNDRPAAFYRLNERNGSQARDFTARRAPLEVVGTLRPFDIGAAPKGSGGATLFGGEGYLHSDARLASHLRMTGSFTVELWFNQQSFSDSQCLLSKGFDQSVGYYRFLYNEQKQAYQFNVKFEQSGTFGEDTLIPKKRVTPFEWHHMVGVYDATAQELRYYLDGKLEATLNVAGKTLAGNDEDFEIGAMPDPRDLGFRYMYNGGLCDVALYKTALSPGRILAHYQTGQSGH